MGRSAQNKDADKSWLKKFQELKALKKDGKKEGRALYRWILDMRKNYRRTLDSMHWEWRIPLLLSIGIDIEGSSLTVKAPTQENVHPFWRDVILKHAKMEESGLYLEWFKTFLERYKSRAGFLKAAKYNSMGELILKCMKVGDIKPEDCIRNLPYFELRHTLSYIVEPLAANNQTGLKPTWKFLSGGIVADVVKVPEWDSNLFTGNTIYFGSECFGTGFFDDVISELPSWMMECYEEKQKPKGSNLIDLIAKDA